MVGTSLDDVRGGIGAVVRGYRDSGLFERFAIRYVTTHREGPPLTKASAALAAYVRLTSELLRGDSPLVHVHLASRASFWRKSIVCALASLWRRPCVLHVHGGDFSKFYEEECGRIAKAVVRSTLRRAALVLALSEQWRTTLLRICPSARVRVLPNSVQLSERSTPATSDTSARILYTGRISVRKGTFDLLEGFARIAGEFPQATLTCAGDGEGEQILARAKALGLEGRVACPGWISSAEVAQELDRATVFALPSHAEGVPMAVLEAMARGLPVLTTPVGGIPEVVQNGRNGILVTPGDIEAIAQSLRTLLASASERVRLGEAARETIEKNFALPVTLDKLAGIYREFGLVERR
jgi:glycosyltransferase involved in cell wall biosynthesis